jgi:D-3-phosphoglycerate dehydrogenase
MEVARRARAFGMEIVGHDPFVSASIAKENGIRMGKLVTSTLRLTTMLHVGLTPQTTGMINAESINTGRGRSYQELRPR